MKDTADHYAVPLFLIVFAAALLIYGHRTSDADLRAFASGIGGGGLALLTGAVRQTLNKISGGPVSIDQTPTTPTTA